MNNKPFSLFSVYGIELEYMIVNKTTLNALPIADKVIEHLSGVIQNEFCRGEIAISNELALHVIELKTNGPKPILNNLSNLFNNEIKTLNKHLELLGAKLMPTGTHPWLNPSTDIKLWPHGDRKIYNTYHKIFNCSGHGWGNLQSTHLNLPFANDQEFKQLHDAIRLILPIIPALTASTPIFEGQYCGHMDGRLYYYGKNQRKIPIISGEIIPEAINSKNDYLTQVLMPIDAAIAPFDQDNILQAEWLNSRGAIARFERDAIEIRIIDNQESPYIDLALVEAIVAVLKYLVNNNSTEQISSQALKCIYDSVIEAGSETLIIDSHYLQMLGFLETECKVKTVWGELIKRTKDLSQDTQIVLQQYQQYGNLAERIKQSIGEVITKDRLKAVYHKLCQCLNENSFYLP